MITESEWESIVLDNLAELDWQTGSGKDFETERSSLASLVLQDRLLGSLRHLNPQVPDQYLQQAKAEMLSAKSQDAITDNHRFHRFLVEGYRGITYIDSDGKEQTPTLRLLGSSPEDNQWLVVQQVRLEQHGHKRRLDVVCYVNGLPLLVMELKQAGNRYADLGSAREQLNTYLDEFPMAFQPCVLAVISDGITAKYGTMFTPLNHFAPWNVDDDGRLIGADDASGWGVENLLFGIATEDRFLDIVNNFVAFDETDDGLDKRVAKPHQYFAVRKAVERTHQAVDSNGKAGVVWHTQGSGKSMEMELYANLVLRDAPLLNPTLVVITDRNELDGQLYETFKRSTLLPEGPVQVRKRSQLRDELTNRTTGGILFTTLQKFSRTLEERGAGEDHPLLTDRRNVIVIVDEAHRSHYDSLDGYARHLHDALPRATFIAFTGTPISFDDRNTQEVFGSYVDIYDLTRAVRDGATVPVSFEPRLVQVQLAEDVSPEDLDAAADEETKGLDEVERERIERSVAVINAIYGAPERVAALAADIVAHWETRRANMRQFIECNGKAMIVCSTREICARLYDDIVKLRPQWHSNDLDKGAIKVVYSGSASDPKPIRNHVRRDSENKVIKQRLREADDQLEIVIVKDMMLTGYDSQPLHTLYLDRPIKGALLMQTLARVNRTYKGKQDGLLVSYAPLFENLKAALAEYTVDDQTNKPVGRSTDEAAAVTRQLVAAIRELVQGFDWRTLVQANPKHGWVDAAKGLTNWLRSPSTPGNQAAEGEDTVSDRFRQLSGQLSRMWALAAGMATLSDLQQEIRFYEETRVWMAKYDAAAREASGEPIPEDIARILKGLVADATAAGAVTDIYEAAGIEQPTLDYLTPSNLLKAQQSPNPQLAIEAIRALLVRETERATKNNVVRHKAFSERIQELMNRYTNQQLTSAEVLKALADMAAEVADEDNRGKRFDPPLDRDELAFYDAVCQNDSAVLAMGDSDLAQIGRDLVDVMRRDVKTDWTRRADVQARVRSSVRRLLRLHGYPPDRQPGAVKLVLEQMETLAPGYAEQP